MQPESTSGLDWRDGADYAPLLGADRSLIAWEWLRRDPKYRIAAERALPACGGARREDAAAAAFGLVGFEAPHLGVPHARPLWRSEVHPFVLPVDVRHGGVSAVEKVDVAQIHDLARIIADRGTEYLLLSDGLRSIRLDGPPGVFTSGPTCLRYSIEGLVAAEAALLTLRRFLALCRSGHFSLSLHRRETRAARWIMMLRAHDGVAAGADQRQIAQVLFSRSVVDARWRSREPSVRSQAQRLVRSARRFAAGGYRWLLADRSRMWEVESEPRWRSGERSRRG